MYSNRRYQRHGQLFQNRYKSVICCDVEAFRKSARISARDVENRDLLIYLIWQSGGWTNQAIGDRFGLTYSAVSRRVSIFKNQLGEDQALLQKFAKIRSSLGRGPAES